jgi:uncharacterized membrane protein
MERKQKALGRVFAIVSLVAVVAGLAAELLQRYYTSAFPVAPVFYAVIVVAGAWGSVVGSPAYGAAGGALAAFLYSLAAGVVFLFSHAAVVPVQVKPLIAALVVSPVCGAVIGLFVGYLVWLVKRWRRSSAQ